MVNIEIQLSLEDYINVNMHITFRKIIIKVFTGIGILFLLIALFNLTTWLTTDLNPNFPLGEFILGFIFTFGLPLFVYWNSRLNYKSNARIRERITYSFTEDLLEIKGESFNTQMTWEKMFKVTESKDLILLWQNRQLANVIPKKYLNSEQLKELKALILKIPNLRTTLQD